MAQPAVEEKIEGDYLFKFQFFVHECALNKDFFNISKPAIALRFLDFPTLIIEGSLTQYGALKFGLGKKCNFKMHSDDLRQALNNKPFFVMFVDASANNIQMLASSNVSLSAFATKNSEFFEVETPNWNLRRNFLSLFDNMKNEIMKLEVSIGISLLERQEQERMKDKLERIHPSIPNARIGEKDRAALSMQQFQGPNNAERRLSDGRVHVHFQENEDPNQIIRQNKRTFDYNNNTNTQSQSNLNTGKNLGQGSYHSQRSNQQQLTSQNNIVITDDLSGSAEVKFEDSSKLAQIEESERARQAKKQETIKIVQQVEVEMRQAQNQEKKESSLQALLNQPYHPPPMFYERKPKVQPEKALIMKQSQKLKGPQVQIVKEALTLQEQRYREELDVKERLIEQQKEMIARQHTLIKRQIDTEATKEQIQEQKKKDPDVIELHDIQKIRELDTADRYRVLEFLVKELISLKGNSEQAKRKTRKNKKGGKKVKRIDGSQSDDEEDESYDDEDQEDSQADETPKQKKKYQMRNQGKVSKGTSKVQAINKKIEVENIDKQGKKKDNDDINLVESISVDENNKIIQSSRKEWEEELTSTQNLGLSTSGIKKSSNRGYVDPIVKLNNFVAANPPSIGNKFSNIGSSNNGKQTQKRKESEMSENYEDDDDEEEDDDYSEDFESLSKSQLGLGTGLSMSKVSVKRSLNHQQQMNGEQSGENYSGEQFESMAESKTLSNNEDKIICFMCKQNIPKSQAASHSSICKKMSSQPIKKKNTQDETSKRKYSPIKESEDEENSNHSDRIAIGSKHKSPAGVVESSDNYSSSKFEESGSSRVMTSGRKAGMVSSSLRKNEDRKSADYLRESYLSSSVSTEKNNIVNQFSKQVAEFNKDADDDSSSLSKSNDNHTKGGGSGTGNPESINEMYEKYKKMQELLAKYNSGDYEDSATISKSM